MQDIINKILAGNYWLTKSMEFSKTGTSGSLWYLKKWFVYYHFVFLKEKLFNSDYQQITEIFQKYIDSIPLANKQQAINFFFNVDIRGEEFMKLNEFLTTRKNFATREEEKLFKINGKRFYFMYLMNLGGQSGYKEMMKAKIDEGKNYKTIVKEIIRNILADGHNQAKVIEQLTDFPAAIRNERQIHFYYGFFHGKESKDLSGFYNLTPIGKAILKANFAELLIIWEHQKLKMISQSPVADIQNISDVEGAEHFSILNSPYFTLLNILSQKGEITDDQYQYVISKITNYTSQEIIVNQVLGNLRNENKFKQKAESFDRDRETNQENYKGILILKNY